MRGETISRVRGDLLGDLSETGEQDALADVRLLAPLDPPNIICIGLNYRKHAEESGAKLPERPVIFAKTTTAATGPGEPILVPAMAPDEVDYEAEIAIVIGKTAKNVTEGEAPGYILGYTCANDVSARDCQRRLDVQWTRAKSFDTFCPFGPWIETDMDPDNARISMTLNGQVMQDSSTSDMIFGTRALVSYISHAMTLLPGTIILTGTPPGVGFARTPPVFLKPGDVCEVEVEGIGVLRNPVAAG